MSACTPTQALLKAGDIADDVGHRVGEYANSQWDVRVRVRDECWDLVQREADVLEDEGKYAEARELYASVYPSLIITDLFDKGLQVAAVPEVCGGFLKNGVVEESLKK